MQNGAPPEAATSLDFRYVVLDLFVCLEIMVFVDIIVGNMRSKQIQYECQGCQVEPWSNGCLMTVPKDFGYLYVASTTKICYYALSNRYLPRETIVSGAFCIWWDSNTCCLRCHFDVSYFIALVLAKVVSICGLELSVVCELKLLFRCLV